jgi:hypothetical protein
LGLVSKITDRFDFAHRRFTVASTGFSSTWLAQYLFYQDAGLVTDTLVDTVGEMSVDFRTGPANAGANGFPFAEGILYFLWHPTIALRPARVEVIAQASVSSAPVGSVVLADFVPSSIGYEAVVTVPPQIGVIHSVVIRITPKTGTFGRVASIGYFPQRPWSTEQNVFLRGSSQDAQSIFSPGLRVVDGTAIGELKPNAVEIRSTTGSTRWRIQVNDSGVITTTSI